ncbi:hypothetical protein Tco_0889725 [Tanacetum coccineum]
MKEVRTSSQVSIVPSLSLSSHVFASPYDILPRSWFFDLESPKDMVFMLGEKGGKFDAQRKLCGVLGSNSKGAEFKVTFPRNCMVRLLPMAAISVHHNLSYADTNQAARKHLEPSWSNAILDNEEVACDDGFARRRRPGALLRACCLFVSPSKSMG